jgi:hypothetical protein
MLKIVLWVEDNHCHSAKSPRPNRCLADDAWGEKREISQSTLNTKSRVRGWPDFAEKPETLAEITEPS